MNSDFQIGVWGFKGVRNLGETRENKNTTEGIFSEPQSLVLLQNLEMNFVSVALFCLRTLRFLPWNLICSKN